MLFGRERVVERLHMFATAMVAFGTLMSATWILSVNSWMQTPAGFSINEVGQFVPEEDEPPVAIVFWSFRIMVGLCFAMLGLGAWSLLARWRGHPYNAPWLHRTAILMGPTGFVAVLAGWITTQVGRQPFTVYGLLPTSDSLAPVAAPAAAASLISFIVVYFFVFGAGTFYIMRMMIKRPATPNLGLGDGPIRTAGITPAPPVDPNFILGA